MASIYLLSTSTAVPDRARFRRAVARLKALGHTVEIDESALAKAQRFAGDDATRLAAIARAADSGADIVMGTRGGYGLSRLLADLPHKAIAKSVKSGSRWIGFSDWTALQFAHSAWWQRRGGAMPELAWWQGPMLLDDWSRDEKPDEITQACFADLVAGICEGGGWRLSPRDAACLNATKSVATNPAPMPANAQKVKESKGQSIAGQLWGGNLSMVASLVGTPHLPQVSGGILWLEDVGEHPYRSERLLTQLLHAGVLKKQKAVVLAQFNGWKPLLNDKGYGYPTVADWLAMCPPSCVCRNSPARACSPKAATRCCIGVDAQQSQQSPNEKRRLCRRPVVIVSYLFNSRFKPSVP
jgi:muramoyltetrapeptide carboxypeptidase